MSLTSSERSHMIVGVVNSPRHAGNSEVTSLTWSRIRFEDCSIQKIRGARGSAAPSEAAHS